MLNAQKTMKDLKGTIKIRKGDDATAPMIVYVSHINTLGYWVTPKLNTGETYFSENTRLIDFSYAKFQQMYYRWEIDNLKIKEKRFQELLSEWE